MNIYQLIYEYLISNEYLPAYLGSNDQLFYRRSLGNDQGGCVQDSAMEQAELLRHHSKSVLLYYYYFDNLVLYGNLIISAAVVYWSKRWPGTMEDRVRVSIQTGSLF